MLHTRSISVSLVVLLLALAVPANAFDPFGMRTGQSRGSRQAVRVSKQVGVLPDLDSYDKLGAWVDMFNKWPWDNPGKVVKAMARRGVTTLYLETSNYNKANDIYRPTQMSKILEAAHAIGMDVVAWYVPGFQNMKRDKRRSKAAVDFRSKNGERFDSFAMDIEATPVRDIATRNRRAVRLSRYLREHVGGKYPLGAIVPEAGALYWPSFPYKELRPLYDVFLPMAYYTYRVDGATAVKRWIANNIETIRRETGDARVPIHVIGGLGGAGTVREVKAFVQKLIDKKVMGGSFYDFPITTNAEWKALARLAG